VEGPSVNGAYGQSGEEGGENDQGTNGPFSLASVVSVLPLCQGGVHLSSVLTNNEKYTVPLPIPSSGHIGAEHIQRVIQYYFYQSLIGVTNGA